MLCYSFVEYVAFLDYILYNQVICSVIVLQSMWLFWTIYYISRLYVMLQFCRVCGFFGIVFTMLCQLRMCSPVVQSHTQPSSGFFPHRLLQNVQYLLPVPTVGPCWLCFMCGGSCVSVNPASSLSRPRLSALVTINLFSTRLWVYFSFLSSFVSFFVQIPHISGITYLYFCFQMSRGSAE